MSVFFIWFLGFISSRSVRTVASFKVNIIFPHSICLANTTFSDSLYIPIYSCFCRKISVKVITGGSSSNNMSEWIKTIPYQNEERFSRLLTGPIPPERCQCKAGICSSVCLWCICCKSSTLQEWPPGTSTSRKACCEIKVIWIQFYFAFWNNQVTSYLTELIQTC